jgi:hypothetical protein
MTNAERIHAVGQADSDERTSVQTAVVEYCGQPKLPENYRAAR